MRASLLAAVVLAVAVSGCSSTPPPAFDQADTQSINNLVQEFIKAYNAKDAAHVAKLFGDTGAVLPPNASTVRGSENVREYYVKRFRQGASDLALDVGEVVGAESLAFATGDYRLNMAPEGGEPRRDRGKFLFILRERKGIWQLERLAFSSDFAPDRAG
jgi:uncharacterized protein (TIGR02246 family)